MAAKWQSKQSPGIFIQFIPSQFFCLVSWIGACCLCVCARVYIGVCVSVRLLSLSLTHVFLYFLVYKFVLLACMSVSMYICWLVCLASLFPSVPPACLLSFQLLAPVFIYTFVIFFYRFISFVCRSRRPGLEYSGRKISILSLEILSVCPMYLFLILFFVIK